MSSSNVPHNLQRNVNVAPYTSWLIGGEADYFCLPQSTDECIEALKWAKSQNLQVTLLGGGSNVLVSDQGVRGLLVCLRKLAGLESREEQGRLHITAMAGAAKSELLKIFLKYKLVPALFLAGLPGDVGGGVVMNAGVSENINPREFVGIVDWVDVLDTNTLVTKRFLRDELRWSYRHCDEWQPGIVVSVGLSWPLEPQDDILQKVRDANRVRLQKQPLNMPSCGSVFINPPGHKAGQLIDQCGLRGFRIGDAQVSEKHANFIVNLGSATALQTHQVIQHVQKIVLQKTGVQLRTEVQYLGEWASEHG